MRAFDYLAAERLDQALAAVARPGSVAVAGGTELLNWMRLGIAAPERLVDLGRLPGLDGIAVEGGALRIGALCTLNQVGEHPLVREHAAVLAEACLKAASPQVRNRATIGGNLLQRTRCDYFRAEAPLSWGCNKRAAGSGCAAIGGLNHRHSIFGWTGECVATHPADPPVALAALDATVELAGGQRVPAAEFHLSQQEAGTASVETRLAPGELITGVAIPIVPRLRSAYVKVRERESYHYALVSAAATLVLDGEIIADARVALGSVAQRPWRLPEAEAALEGRRPVRAEVLPAIEAALAEARPLSGNGYKVAMAAGAATRAVLLAEAAR